MQALQALHLRCFFHSALFQTLDTLVRSFARVFAGKGRIQNVVPLEDGSGVSVTKAKYVTPSGKDIHGVGLTPDQISTTCGPTDAPENCLAGIL